MKKNHDAVARFWRDQRGISSIEYVLLLAFVGAGIVAGAGFMREAIERELTVVAECIGDASPSPLVCE